MKMLKKIILILAALCLVLCLVACDSDKGTTGDDNTDAKTDKNVGVSTLSAMTLTLMRSEKELRRVMF